MSGLMSSTPPSQRWSSRSLEESIVCAHVPTVGSSLVIHELGIVIGIRIN